MKHRGALFFAMRRFFWIAPAVFENSQHWSGIWAQILGLRALVSQVYADFSVFRFPAAQTVDQQLRCSAICAVTLRFGRVIQLTRWRHCSSPAKCDPTDIEEVRICCLPSRPHDQRALPANPGGSHALRVFTGAAMKCSGRRAQKSRAHEPGSADERLSNFREDSRASG